MPAIAGLADTVAGVSKAAEISIVSKRFMVVSLR
jgi:hypothetical protein